ncbi:MAG: GspE/PulE family protein [Candidatus Spechtbacterales bacterium]
MMLFEEKILNSLVKASVMSAAQAQKTRENIASSNLSLETYLLREFKISEPQILKAKSEASEMQAWQYDEEKDIPKELLGIIPQDAAEQYQMVPLEKRDKKIFIGMVDPTNIKSQQALRFILLRSELVPEIVVITEQDFNKVISQYKGMRVEVKSALEEIEKSLEERPRGSALEERVTALKETPVTKIVAVILKHATEGGASDVHIEPMRNNTKVRYRVDGILYPSLLLPSTIHAAIVARVKILASLRLDESRIPQDGRFTTQMGRRSIDFRVSTFPTDAGEKIVMRVLDPNKVLLNFDEIGLVGENRRKFEQAIKEPYGMILVSGPTGSGKTTTLYSAMLIVNKESVNAVSLEDPIEYHMEGVSQSQIRPEIDYTFASGLRYVVRQDPDILMVGEIRDSETAKLATQAALTGHLLFSTVHTNNAMGIIPRLLDLGVEGFLLPSALLLGMAQRLIGRLCKHCKEEQEVPAGLSKMFDEEMSKLPRKVLQEFKIQKPYKLWDSKGCPKCNNKRTKGRIAIFEILQMTSQLKRIIAEENASSVKIEEEAKRQGMITMRQDGIIKALQGTVSIQDVLRVVEEQYGEEERL